MANLKTEIIAAISNAPQPLNCGEITDQTTGYTQEQVARQLYDMKAAKEVIGEKETHGRRLYRYRMPTEADMISARMLTEADVLNARIEAEVDEIELDKIEAIERLVAATKPINGSVHVEDQPESAVSETVEEAIAEPINVELLPFRVGVFNDGKMMLMRDVVGNASVAFAISKEELAELVEFARTVGWLPA